MRIRSAILVSSWIPGLFAQAVLTRSYNDLRTGANTQETHLTPANVGSLKVLRELTPDAGDDVRIEAQPLYVPQLAMADGPHDTAIVCTMANNVYAFDVNTGAKLWKTNLGTPIKPIVQGQTANGQQQTDIDSWGINHLWGILSTPVIDIDTKTLYVVSWSSSGGARNTAVHKLNALNLVTGQAAHPALTIKGQAAPAARFNSPDQKQRAALLLAPLTGGSKKALYMGCGMTSETATADHGWLMAFDVGTFTQTSAWCTTPKSHGGGIWGAGAGPAAAGMNSPLETGPARSGRGPLTLSCSRNFRENRPIAMAGGLRRTLDMVGQHCRGGQPPASRGPAVPKSSPKQTPLGSLHSLQCGP